MVWHQPNPPVMNGYPSFPEYANRDSIPRMPAPNTVPQSPTSSAGVEDEEFVRSTTKQPDPSCHVFDGRIYGLKVIQQPNRARMCGFGDKDRRPISAPPIVQLIIIDEATKEEIDYTDNNLELSHFVCQVDIYNRDGSSPKNLLRSSQSGSSISMTVTGGYPVTQATRAPDVHAQQLSIHDPVHRMLHGPHTSQHGQPQNGYGPYQPVPGPYSHPNNGYAAASNSNGQFPVAYGPPREPDPYGHYPASNPYEEPARHRSSLPSIQTSYQHQSAVPPGPYTAPSHGAHTNYSPQGSAHPNSYGDVTHAMPSNYPPQRAPPTPPADGPTGSQVKVDRNLIGTLCTSAVLLKDLEDKDGIFFIWGDLSVRTEDWFSLKFSFFNVGGVLRDASWEELAARAKIAKTYPSNPPKEGTARNDKVMSGIRAPLLAKTAPCLATVFSQCFKVFSAKKFPGVVESTKLNAHFAKQGVKITVRSDKDGNGKRKRDGDDDDDDD